MGTDMSKIPGLMSAEEVEAERQKHRYSGGGGKGPSRLQATEAARPLTLVGERAFKKSVRDHDQMHCRKCKRRVEALVSRVAKRAEVHHCYGRKGDFRFDDRFAILLCLNCHEQLTGRVNEKWRIVPVPTSLFILIAGRELIDCRGPLDFERVA